jgi:hypothetical protein
MPPRPGRRPTPSSPAARTSAPCASRPVQGAGDALEGRIPGRGEREIARDRSRIRQGQDGARVLPRASGDMMGQDKTSRRPLILVADDDERAASWSGSRSSSPTSR